MYKDRKAVPNERKRHGAVSPSVSLAGITTAPALGDFHAERAYDRLVDDIVRQKTGVAMPKMRRAPRDVRFTSIHAGLLIDLEFEERMVEVL